VYQYFFKRSCGFSEDSKGVIFDEEKLLKNYDTIKYLYGQLKDVHSKNKEVTPISSSLKYSGEPWTNNSAVILEFLHL